MKKAFLIAAIISLSACSSEREDRYYDKEGNEISAKQGKLAVQRQQLKASETTQQKANNAYGNERFKKLSVKKRAGKVLTQEEEAILARGAVQTSSN